MEIRVGTDILKHERIKTQVQDPNDPFVAYTFSGSERKQAAQSSNPLAYYAGRFCVKEAVIKALNGQAASVEPRQIETVSGQDGAPEVHLLDGLKGWTISASISHEDEYSIASVVAYRE